MLYVPERGEVIFVFSDAATERGDNACRGDARLSKFCRDCCLASEAIVGRVILPLAEGGMPVVYTQIYQSNLNKKKRIRLTLIQSAKVRYWLCLAADTL